MAVIDELRTGFTRSTMLMKLVWINIAVFILLRLTAIGGMFMADSSGFIDYMLHIVEMPSRPSTLLTRPWTPLTYMFAQYDLLHILFNMLWLYWFGTLFRMRCTSRQMLTLYICGGLGGALLFFAAYNLLPVFAGATGWLIGSSASVMAIVTATAMLIPDFRMNLFLIGSVKLKWIAIATIILVLAGISGSNAGGEIAHVGGIITGALFATRLKRRSTPRKPHADTSSRYPASAGPQISADERRELDIILEKIKKSGYTGLTSDERRRLFDLSRNIKNGIR